MDNERITSAGIKTGEQRQEAGLRPQYLADYIGQQSAKENLKIFIDAARLRGEPLDHVLFYGPPGLGKTTLAGIIANELGVDIKITSGPAIGRAGDLAAILTNLNLPWKTMHWILLSGRDRPPVPSVWTWQNSPLSVLLHVREVCLRLSGTVSVSSVSSKCILLRN